MKWFDLGWKELQTPESNAFIFTAERGEYKTVTEFGQACASIEDDEGFLIEPFNKKDYNAAEISEKEFWERCTTTMSQYLKDNTEMQLNSINTVVRFWDEWNNSFYAAGLKSGKFYGIFWWTTA